MVETGRVPQCPLRSGACREGLDYLSQIEAGWPPLDSSARLQALSRESLTRLGRDSQASLSRHRAHSATGANSQDKSSPKGRHRSRSASPAGGRAPRNKNGARRLHRLSSLPPGGELLGSKEGFAVVPPESRAEAGRRPGKRGSRSTDVRRRSGSACEVLVVSPARWPSSVDGNLVHQNSAERHTKKMPGRRLAASGFGFQ